MRSIVLHTLFMPSILVLWNSNCAKFSCLYKRFFITYSVKEEKQQTFSISKFSDLKFPWSTKCTQLDRPTKRQNASWKLNGKDGFICPTAVRSLQCYFLLCNFENPCMILYETFLRTHKRGLHFRMYFVGLFCRNADFSFWFSLFKIGCRFRTDCTFSLEILAKPHYMGNLSTSRCTLWNQAQSFLVLT